MNISQFNNKITNPELCTGGGAFREASRNSRRDASNSYKEIK
jgi:hypothetical protein